MEGYVYTDFRPMQIERLVEHGFKAPDYVSSKRTEHVGLGFTQITM